MLILQKKYFLKFVILAYACLKTVALQAQFSSAESLSYKISHWTADDGLPGNSFTKITQDNDGFLWMGSYDGLVRFDGSNFITFNKNHLLTSNFAITLTGDKSGNLWIGTDHGIAHYKKGKITDLSDDDHSFYVQSLLLDEAEHKLWIGTRNQGLVSYDVKSNRYESVGSLDEDDFINDVLKGKDGSLWIASEKKGLLQFKNKAWKLFDSIEGLRTKEVVSLNFDDKGTLYIGTTSGLFILRGNEKIIEVKKFEGIRINKVAVDKKGNLWVGSVNGLYYQSENHDWKFISRENGLSNNDVRDIFFDSSENIWVATYRGGVNQLRETYFSTYFNKEGQYIEAVGAICALSESKLLVGTTEGQFFTVEDGQINPYAPNTKIHQRIYYLLLDRQKNIWAASYDGLLLISPDGKERLFTNKDGLTTNQVRIIFQDAKNDYWIGTRNAGLIKMTFNPQSRKPVFEQHLHDSLSKFNATFIMDINEDTKGNLLICSNNGGVVIISPDGHLKNYNRKNGLLSNTCYIIREDKNETYWITTTDGVTWLRNGESFTFTPKDGLPHENPMDVIEDDLGFMWFPTQRGIIRASKQQLTDYANHKLQTIEWKLFDKNNDLEKSECTGTAHSLKANGKIWFPVIRGLVSVDPSVIHLNRKKPRVYIEKVGIDDEEVDVAEPIVVEAGNHRVQFDYLALTLHYPNSARYKYKLNNFDKDWIDAGTIRQAVYTSLPPGKYSFSVMACDNDGAWNSSELVVPIRVKPYYYQTWWFISFVVVALMAVVYGYIRIRTRDIKRRSAYLEQLIKNRTKLIAEQRDKLIKLNEELQFSQREVLNQRDSLAEKNKELAEKNEEIEQINNNLEKIVELRTKTLEDQNKRISDYSFINAHKLRGPLASILGLINLMHREASNENQRRLNEHLLRSAEALDDIVRSINRMLEGEFKEPPPMRHDSADLTGNKENFQGETTESQKRFTKN